MINGFYEKSVFHFLDMINLGFRVDEVSLSSVISANSNLDQTFNFGESIHGLAIKTGFEGIQIQTRYNSVSNALVLFYSQYKDIESAKRVFMQNGNKNVVSHNSLIKGLVYNARLIEALHAFQCMQLDYKTRPDLVTMVAVISPCGELNLLLEGKSIHAYNIRCNTLSLDSSIGNNLINMYFKCNCPIYARKLFDKMPNKDLISWNTMISCYSRNEILSQEAQNLFLDLVRVGIRCNLSTFLGILASFCGKDNLNFGKLIHGLVFKYAFVDTLSVINALMHMYISCGELMISVSILKNILFKSDIISWNIIISGFIQNGLVREALKAFHFMHSNLGRSPDCITLVSVLSTCADLKAPSFGKSIHGFVLKRLIQFDVRVINSLMNMYFKFGEIGSANNIFEFDEERSLCTWNCMINGYIQNGEVEKALELYLEMRNHNFIPNEITIVSILGACAQIGDLKHGKEINAYVFRNGLENNIYIMSSLLDMYSKCGTLKLAKRIFKISQEKSIASWNSMISAFGLHGEGEKSIGLFRKMCELEIKPTKSTFIALLSACSHAGLVEQGLRYYNLMPVKFGINHSVEHIVCLIEMLGRAGRFKEAFKFLKESRLSLDQGVLGALLGACSDYYNNDINVCKLVAQHLFCVEPNNAGYYVTLCNLLARREMWDQVSEIRRCLRIKGLVKPPAFSSIDA
ncbi:hypothetical protein LUZ60_013266 [Juncus effusus]|nr:hypothetical protein LUZ60_013266 [Juncus effusus]